MKALIVITINFIFCLTCFAQSDKCNFVSRGTQIASNIRNLKTKHRVTCKAISKDDFKVIAQQTIESDIKVEQLKYESTILQILGFIPRDYNYPKCILDGLSSMAVAFYDTKTKSFYIPDWTNTPDSVVVHEVTHALQDQHFNTEKIGSSRFIFSDVNIAAAALVEGDAEVVESEYLTTLDNSTPALEHNAPVKPISSECDLPPTLKDLFDAGYAYGQYFIRELIENGGYASVNKAFKAPPLTTREILHFKDYLACKPRYKLTLIKPSLIVSHDKGHLKFSDTIGELAIRILFKSYLPLNIALKASAGWRGDTIALFSDANNTDSYTVTWNTAWDTEKDAEEFLSAFKEILRMYHGVSVNKLVQNFNYTSHDWSLISFRHSKNNVQIIVKR